MGFSVLGRAVFSPFRTKERQAEDVEIPQALASILGDDEKLCTPATGANSELASLVAHVNGRLPCTKLPSEEAVDRVVAEYPKTVFRHEITSNSYWLYLISTLNRNSSPGYPLALEHVQNKSIIDFDPYIRAVVQQAVDRLRKLSSISTGELKEKLIADPAWAVKNGYADVVRVMIKNAIHPARKKETGKWRLVRSVTLVDQLVEKFLYTVQDDAEIAVWQSLPSKVGFGHTDTDATSLSQYVRSKGLNTSTDVSAWDFGVSEEWLMVEAEMRIRLCESPDWWKTAVRNQFLCNSRSILMLSDGRCLVLSVPGTQCSGRKVTASSNSRLRFLLNASFMVDRGLDPAAMTMGDDCIEKVDDAEAYKAHAMQCGFKLTDLQAADADDFEFCSHRFLESKPIPVSPLKQVMNVLLKTDASDVCMLWDKMRHHPALEALKQYFEEEGPSLKI